MNPDSQNEDFPLWIREVSETHRTALQRYVTRLLGEPNRASDVVQDTFVRLLEQRREEVEGHLVEWLFTVARRRAIDVQRKEGRMKPLDTSGGGEPVSEEERPGAALERAETKATLLGLVGKLTEAQQEVVRLKFQNGFSYKEISRITEKSVSHVGVLLHEALMKLRAEAAALEN